MRHSYSFTMCLTIHRRLIFTPLLPGPRSLQFHKIRPHIIKESHLQGPLSDLRASDTLVLNLTCIFISYSQSPNRVIYIYAMCDQYGLQDLRVT